MDHISRRQLIGGAAAAAAAVTLNAPSVRAQKGRQTLRFVAEANVILKAVDWSTNLTVRARKEAPERGGWSILHTWWMAADVINPAVHFGVLGAGPSAWFGWPDVPQLDKLTTDWVRATDPAKRKQIAEEIQKIALSEVTYIPWGEWVQPTAFRKNIQGVLKLTAPVFWNVRVT
jgi:peptide/nickel transport system substrate-binding protein